MSRMFCTLKEAAETLHASEDQIEALLESGLLREFREGPHRLVKEADVGALASVGQQRATTPRPASWPAEIQRPFPAPRTHSKASHGAATTARPRGPRPANVRAPKTADKRPKTAPPSVSRQAPGTSLRQWFWMGLVQDRPFVIALLSGLVLLGLSALAAGLFFVAEIVNSGG